MLGDALLAVGVLHQRPGVVLGLAAGAVEEDVGGAIGGDVPEKTLRRWAESLAGVARTGLGFTQSQYERERLAMT